MCKLLQKSFSLKRSLATVSFLVGLSSVVFGQNPVTPTPQNRSAAVSIEAQRLIIQSTLLDSEKAKEIALKRPIRKMVGQYGYELDFKSPRKRSTSARRIIIRHPKTYMSTIP